MKLVFSEATPDYARYLYPYVIWARPDPGEEPADLLAAGFLPSARGFNQFYLCRQVRVDLRQYTASSENRRILRKGVGIGHQLIPRPEFDFNSTRREFCHRYAEVRYGPGIMPLERLDLVFQPPVTTHVMRFHEEATGTELGLVVLYLAAPRIAFYRYSFYDLQHSNRSLGMYLMTAAVEAFAAHGIQYLYLGTCYSESALYKTQFQGLEFFNGFRWSANLEELKYLLRRDQTKHLVETEAFRQQFYAGKLEDIFAASPFQLNRA